MRKLASFMMMWKRFAMSALSGVTALGLAGIAASATAMTPTSAGPGRAAAAAPMAAEPVDCAAAKCIALTFDDGPGKHTGRLLDILAEKGVKATFFLIGENVEKNPQLVKREVEEGHLVANHSWDHPKLPTLSAGEVASQLTRTNDAISAAAGVTPQFFRPPYGALSDTVNAAAADLGLTTILWSDDTEDWQHRDTDLTLQRALAQATPGAIVLMHDIHASTVDAVGPMIEQLTAQGYVMVTVAQLLGDDAKPGARFSGKVRSSKNAPPPPAAATPAAAEATPAATGAPTALALTEPASTEPVTVPATTGGDTPGAPAASGTEPADSTRTGAPTATAQEVAAKAAAAMPAAPAEPVEVGMAYDAALDEALDTAMELDSGSPA